MVEKSVLRVVFAHICLSFLWPLWSISIAVLCSGLFLNLQMSMIMVADRPGYSLSQSSTYIPVVTQEKANKQI